MSIHNNIPWTVNEVNDKVINSVGREIKLLQIIKIRKIAYLDYIFRKSKYELLNMIMKGMIEEKRDIGC